MPIELTVVTPEGQAFDGSVESVVLPGTEGDFGVLEGHEVFLTALRAGTMSISAASGTGQRHAAVSKGFAEVLGTTVTVMVGACDFADEIDLERAKVARDRALKQLEEIRATADGEEAYQEYQEAYSNAVARIAVSERFKA